MMLISLLVEGTCHIPLIRVYCPCIPGVEMLENRISLASPLLALRGGWEAGIMNQHTPIMETKQNTPLSRKRTRTEFTSSDDEHASIHSDDDHEISQPKPDENLPKFIVLKPTYSDQPLTKLSPFAIEKSILGRYGTVKQVKKLKDGSLLIEAAKNIQARLLLDTQNFLGIEVDADAHRSLNVCKGVIRDYHQDLRDMSEEDIRLELASQGVLRVSRFILKKDGKEIKTNTLFLTFDNHVPPEKLKIGYYVVTVQPYIPNPLRCFQCQKFGHSKKWCRNKLACWKCGSEGHDGSECTSETTSCLNCKGNHCASSKSCPVWIQEKEIQRVKTEKCLSYGDARRLVTSASSSSSPAACSYASAVKTVSKKVTMNVECQTPEFWIGKQPSLLEASKLNPVQTVSKGSGTSETRPPTSISHQKSSSSTTSEKFAYQKVQSNNKGTKKKDISNKDPKDIETPNKFNTLASDVDEEMDTTHSPRPSRSKSRARSRSKNISPIKHH